MRVILILAGPNSTCDATKIIWENICSKNNIKLEIYDVSINRGKKIIKQYDIKSFPALIFNGKVIAVGHPDEKSAERIIQASI